MALIGSIGRVVAGAFGAPAFAAALAGAARHYAVTPPFRGSHEEVLEHLGSLFAFEGKVAMVTGAAGGVGRATALGLAKAGAHVILADLPSARPELDDLASKVEGLGRAALPLTLDVRDRATVDAAMAEVQKVHGHLDVLIANAGILGAMQPPEALDEDNWRNVFAVNVDGVFHCARAAHPLLKKSGRAKIVVTSSVAGLTGYGPQAPYCASKGALLPLAKSLALAWAKDGINVNVVLPGAVNTPFTTRVLDDPAKLAYILQRIPLGRLAEPEDIVGPILFLASHAADYCTGSLLVVDGGGTSRAMAQ
ncbi:MAG: short-chain dehydrogenase/reductase SDR [Monoraphidium minutum]|nr:MAG: short-chain dehydrogenase/reductase SDR [Monoraphidium minutum]